VSCTVQLSIDSVTSVVHYFSLVAWWFGGLALDLVAAPASQAYVERSFSVCGDLTARTRNKTMGSLKNRVS